MRALAPVSRLSDSIGSLNHGELANLQRKNKKERKDPYANCRSKRSPCAYRQWRSIPTGSRSLAFPCLAGLLSLRHGDPIRIGHVLDRFGCLVDDRLRQDCPSDIFLVSWASTLAFESYHKVSGAVRLRRQAGMAEGTGIEESQRGLSADWTTRLILQRSFGCQSRPSQASSGRLVHICLLQAFGGGLQRASTSTLTTTAAWQALYSIGL